MGKKNAQGIFGFNCFSGIEYSFLVSLEPNCPCLLPWDAGIALLPGEGTEQDHLSMAGRKGYGIKFTIFQKKKPWNWVLYVIEVLCIKLFKGCMPTSCLWKGQVSCKLLCNSIWTLSELSLTFLSITFTSLSSWYNWLLSTLDIQTILRV